MLKKVLLAAASTALLCSSVSVWAGGDAEAGRALYAEKGCAACHGPKGESTNPAMFPVLAGKDAEYISEQLHAFKSGERKGEGPGAIMNQAAGAMSDSDIEDLSAFVGSL